MSHAVSVLAVPQIGLGLGAVGLVALAGYGSYVAVCKLRKDYQQSLAEFQQRCQAEACERNAFINREHATTSAALALAAGTRALAVEDASVRFVRTQVVLLVQRLPKLPRPDPDLDAQCALLMQALDENPLEVAAHFQQYRVLAERIAALLAEGTDPALLKTGLADELTALHDDILSPLLDGDQYAELRAQLQTQLASLQAMVAKHPVLAKQGLALLRERLLRELQAAAVQQQAHMQKAEEMRTLVGDALAKLRAVSYQEYLPDFSLQAVAMLERLSEVLSQVGADDLRMITQLAQDAEALYTDCEKALEEQTIAAYLGDQITDVLLAMGYQVAQVPPEQAAGQHAVVAAVGDELGLEFHIDGHGRLGSEMVALSPHSTRAGHASEERICALADSVFHALKARDCEIRERFRSSLTPGEQLRVVEIAFTEEQQAPAAEALKEMRVEL